MVTGNIRDVILAGLLLTAWTCTDPLKPDVTGGDDPLLVINATTSRLPIYDSAFVDLTWPLLAIDDFTRIEITRYYINVIDTVRNKTLIRTTLYDPNITAWRDTLHDDESVHYQLDVFTLNGLVGSSELDVFIPYTTKFQLLGGGKKFEEVARSILVDPGDTLQLGSGVHLVSNLDLTRKPLLIEGLGNARDVLVTWYALPLLSSGIPPVPAFMTVDDAIIRNLTFTNGTALQGGAIMAYGNTKLRNCIFKNNLAVYNAGFKYGEGGALYLNDNVEVSNCIIVSNTAMNYGSAIYIYPGASDVKIVNTTIISNLAYSDSSAIYTPWAQAQFSIKNCILAQNIGNTINPGADQLIGYEINYNILDSSWTAFDSTNISQPAEFVDPANGDFHLAGDSPGINQGDPDPAYNDTNGSRNDMGAYGGPHGNW